MESVRGRNATLFYSEEELLIPYFNNSNRRAPERKNEPINENVRYPEVRVIGPQGEQLGIMSSRQANALAMNYSLDLYCVAPTANPPVCRICNYGKVRFEKQKQDKLRRKNQKTQELKQIQLTPQIGQHDLETKTRKARECLEEGDRVQVCVVFRGRQMSHQEIGEDVMTHFNEVLQDVAVVDKAPYWEGKWYNEILAPAKKK